MREMQKVVSALISDTVPVYLIYWMIWSLQACFYTKKWQLGNEFSNFEEISDQFKF